MTIAHPKQAKTLVAYISKTTSGRFFAKYESDGFLQCETFATFGEALRWIGNPRTIRRESTAQQTFGFIDMGESD